MQNQNDMVTKLETPLSVKIFSILLGIFSLNLIYVVTVGFSSLHVQETANKINLGLPTNYFTVVTIVGVIFSVFIIILGVFLWKGANWSRISIIIISVVSILILLPTTVGFDILGQSRLETFIGFVPIVFATFVFFDITFNKKIRLFFNCGDVSKSTKILTGVFILAMVFISLGIIGSVNSYKKSLLANYSADVSNKFVGSTVYENTYFKFRFTYPEGSVFVPTRPTTGYIIRFIIPSGKIIVDDKENIGIYIYENVSSLDDWINGQKSAYSKNGPIDISEVRLGGEKAYRMIFTSDYTASKGTKEMFYFTMKNNILYGINYYPVTDEGIKVVDDVAKSFEFI